MTDRLASIVARATPLCDRLHTPLSGPTLPDGDLATARLSRWADRLGGDEQLARRLERSRLTEEQACVILGSTPEAPRALPLWAEILRGAFQSAPASPTEALPKSAGPFVPVYRPLLDHARERLMARLGATADRLSEGAFEDLEAALLKRLMRIGTRVFYADFSVYRACRSPLADLLGGEDAYTAYVRAVREGRIWDVCDVYPVAARLMGRVTEFWLDAVEEFVQRLDTDLDALAEIADTGIGVARRLNVGISDSHGQGRGVFIIDFEEGGRVVYKPRPIELDHLFYDLVAWANATGEALTLRAPRALPMGAYGWIEFVSQGACQTAAGVERFYERSGALLALAYALNGSDFHLENLIASGEHPVLIDMEALLGHRFHVDRGDGTTPMLKATQDSVLRVGMLPMLRFGESGVAADIGGIGGSMQADRPIEILDFKRMNSGAMRLVKRHVSVSNDSFNVARLGDEPTEAAQYIDEIVRGFETMYGMLLRHRESFAARVARELKRQTVRVLIRNTSLYASAVERSLHPKYLRSGIDQGIELDQLARPLLHSDESPRLWAVVADEQKSMADLDIPLFDAPADSLDLPVMHGSAIPAAFEATAESATMERIASLSEADCGMQARIVRGAFEANEARGLQSRAAIPAAAAMPGPADQNEDDLSSDDLVEAATRLGDQVRRSMLDQAADVPIWFTARYNPASGRYTYEPAGYGISDGLGGFALFFAALEALAPRRGYRHVALGAVQPLIRFVERLEETAPLHKLPDPGAGTGLGAVAYALHRVGHLLGDEALVGMAERAARLLVSPATLECDRLGLVSGSAGALVALTSVLNPGDDPAVRDWICQWVEIVTEATEAGSVTTGGFAEGAAGIAFALERSLPFVSDRDRVHRAIARLRERTNDQPSDADYLAAWSEGQPGIAMSGIGARPAVSPRALAAQCADDSVACGRSAYIELALADGDLADARSIANQAVRRAETGWGGHIELGFYRGLAGLGYQVLRAAAPGRIPSVLTWA